MEEAKGVARGRPGRSNMMGSGGSVGSVSLRPLMFTIPGRPACDTTCCRRRHPPGGRRGISRCGVPLAPPCAAFSGP